MEGKGYEFVNSKISSGINGVSKIFLPNADAIATLTATGTRDFVATISLNCQEPDAYKQAFLQNQKSDYKRSYARNYMPFQEAVVMGNEFWTLVGGETAYEELLQIYLEVGREKSKSMLDAFRVIASCQ